MAAKYKEFCERGLGYYQEWRNLQFQIELLEQDLPELPRAYERAQNYLIQWLSQPGSGGYLLALRGRNNRLEVMDRHRERISVLHDRAIGYQNDMVALGRDIQRAGYSIGYLPFPVSFSS